MNDPLHVFRALSNVNDKALCEKKPRLKAIFAKSSITDE